MINERCVKSHLVTRGISKMLWNSKGSPVKVPMSFWNVEPDPLEPMGILQFLFRTQYLVELNSKISPNQLRNYYINIF